MSKFWGHIFGKKLTLPKRILFISSPTSSTDNEDTLDYFASITSQLAIKLQNRYGDVEFVLKVPEPGEKAKEQQALFIERAIESIAPYECIIVSPADRDDLYPKMKQWIKSYGDNKIILIDQGYTLDDYKYFHNDEVARPPYVQADWRNGGSVAAKSMYNYFHKNNINCPHIVLVSGKIGSHQRIEGFKLVMDSEALKSSFDPNYSDCSGDYSKKTARDIFEQSLQNYIQSNKRVDGIFATNDDMALGIQEALLKYKVAYYNKFSSLPDFREPIIIGFDGIRDLTILIDKKDDFIYDTVNVQLKKQIHSLSIIIEKIIMQNTRIDASEKFVDMDCLSYRSIKKMEI